MTDGTLDGLDIMETLIRRVRDLHTVENLFVGETIPADQEYPFVFVMKSGESYSDDLCHPRTLDYVRVDLEVVSDDIHESRSIAAAVKNHLNATGLHTLTFVNDAGNNQTIHGVEVDDHDDEYLPKVVGDDQDLHIAAIDILLTIGE